MDAWEDDDDSDWRRRDEPDEYTSPPSDNTWYLIVGLLLGVGIGFFTYAVLDRPQGVAVIPAPVAPVAAPPLGVDG